VFDPSLAQRPEEKIRQHFLQKMVQELGFPKGLLSVEKEIASFPFRRTDIVVFIPGKEGLIPLLLVECKAGKIGKSALAQALGYNHRIEAPFICLTNGLTTQTYWKEMDQMTSVSFLPSFDQLVKQYEKNLLS
jgi:hypothetical protein